MSDPSPHRVPSLRDPTPDDFRRLLPYVCAVSLDACRSVSRSQREASLALGATRWQMIRSVVLLNARPGIAIPECCHLGHANHSDSRCICFR